jgi:cytochrome P450 family 307 subfamily A
MYGDLFRMKLGSRNCVVVNTLEHMKEVLVTKGGAFGGRPDFMRYHILFGGDRDNCK